MPDANPYQSPEERGQRKRRRVLIATAVAALPLYVLSIGPAVWIMSDRTILIVYWPVIYVAEKLGLDWPLFRYVQWW